MTLNEIKNVIMDVNIDYSSIPEFSEEFEKLGFKYETIYQNEDKEDSSTNVNWESSFKLLKDNKEVNIYISGSAIAEISYEKWVNTYGYSYDRDDITISTNKIEIEDNNIKNFELFLYLEETYEDLGIPHEGKSTKYLKHKNYLIANDKSIANIDEENYQFSDKDIKKINNNFDFINDLLYYNDFCNKIYEIKNTLNLEYDENKLKLFNDNFEEIILYDNGKEDLNELISILKFNDKEIGYFFDKRCKRDNNDYFYFKDVDSLKEIIKAYFNTYEESTFKLINIDILIEKLELENSSFNIFDKSIKFKVNSNFIDKETFDLNQNVDSISFER